MSKREKHKLLDDITNYCFDKGYTRSSIWTFSSEKDANYSSMTRDNFFGVSLKRMYGFELGIAKMLGFLKEKDGIYSMTLKGAFYYHYYENFYTLSYIDKMWGIMRKEAFPERIEF